MGRGRAIQETRDPYTRSVDTSWPRDMRLQPQRTSYRQRRTLRGPGIARLAFLALAILALLVVVDRCSKAPVGATELAETFHNPNLTSTQAAPAAAPPVRTVTATAGSLVRWAGAGIQDCALAGRRFSPIDSACLFPVDLGAEGDLDAERTVLAGGESQVERLRIEIGDYPYAEQHIQLQDTSRVNLSPSNQERAAAERKRIDAVWRQPSARQFQLPMGPPLENPGQPGRFGARRVFNGEPRSPHTGADYKATKGTPVLATADATVALAEEHFFGGKSVFLDHGDELVTMYFHLDEIFVEAGESVTRGAVIGTVGSTGRATGPHLHFGVRWRGDRIDPAAVLGARVIEVE